MAKPYPTWPDDKRWPFALLASCHARPPELQHVPDEVVADLTGRGWVEAVSPPYGFASGHGTLRTTPKGRGILLAVGQPWCLMAANDGVRLLSALRSGDVELRDDWTLVLRRLGRWGEYRVPVWREPVE